MKYLVDANVLVHLANRVPGAEFIHARLTAEPRGRVLLSAVTAHELRFMILSSKASPKHVAGLQAIVREIPVIDFDLPAAHAAADVRLQLKDIGRPSVSSTCCSRATRGGWAAWWSPMTQALGRCPV